MGWAPSATTVTDAAGRFMLCGVSNVGLGHYIFVSKTGFTLHYEPLYFCEVLDSRNEAHTDAVKGVQTSRRSTQHPRESGSRGSGAD